ncbi:MltA domain-containing protein [Methylocapsa sp. D3K7]|uniref:murein transglycosylase A n=1 Tax=Methylocapsa sp. D3K7 TaxID=3041435 RepID=UPI00244EF023|nr:MltA domain-containing protein [Methylocapsa sp. D3K7]WGJ13959.1 MltA domain-containing protein [Methylocapsa sp. D3K7]
MPRSFDDLPGFSAEDHLAAFKVFVRSCEAIAAKAAPLRKGTIASAAFEAIAHAALREDVTDAAQARRFFETHFRPFDISVKGQVPGSNGFLTGYYEPLVEGSLTRSRDFAAPILARPDNLESLKLYPSRAEIEAGSIGSHTRPVVWLRDFVEVFLIQVQGSARIRLMDGRVKRLVYAGRNGLPYTSIGRSLIDSGEITEADMSLAALKQWIRAHGQNPGEAGLTLMHRNQSYVFFDLDADTDPQLGPTGGQAIGLTALRSIAIDRTIWPYGLPFWIDADLPWHSAAISAFRRLMIAQDTGSAIVGPARVDIFFGSGDDAGARAGDIRHAGGVTVLLPAVEGRTGE